MNFLAHIHLSGPSEEIQIGNFIGDFVKGKNYENFPDPVKNGILLHRHIDYFTDTHPVVSLSKSRLYLKYHKYAGIITDIFFDHFLAKNWSDFSDVPLTDFTLQFYEMLKRRENDLPDDVRRFYPYMVENNWLFNYQYLDGIQKSLTGMSRRTKYDSGMENAVEDLKENYQDFEKDFQDFYPDLQTYVKGQLNA